jgi:hypothetical protein
VADYEALMANVRRPVIEGVPTAGLALGDYEYVLALPVRGYLACEHCGLQLHDRESWAGAIEEDCGICGGRFIAVREWREVVPGDEEGGGDG